MGVYDNARQIDFDKLPNKFVLKVNYGSGYNIICRDKKSLDKKEAIKKLSKWIHPQYNHYYHSYKWAYKNIRSKIICEELIEDKFSDDLKDYKFMCLGGCSVFIF